MKDKKTDTTEAVPAAALFVLIGATPHTAWLPELVMRDQWGFVVTGTLVGQYLQESAQAFVRGEP